MKGAVPEMVNVTMRTKGDREVSAGSMWSDVEVCCCRMGADLIVINLAGCISSRLFQNVHQLAVRELVDLASVLEIDGLTSGNQLVEWQPNAKCGWPCSALCAWQHGQDAIQCGGHASLMPRAEDTAPAGGVGKESEAQARLKREYCMGAGTSRA